MNNVTYATKCKHCGAIDSINEKVGGQSFIHVKQSVYVNNAGEFRICEYENKEYQPTEFNNQFTAHYYCRECDNLDWSIKVEDNSLFEIIEIDSLELNRIRNGMNDFMDRCKELGIYDDEGNVNTERCKEIFNKWRDR